MKNGLLCDWLRLNSSGIYRNSALAADRIEELEGESARLQGAIDDAITAIGQEHIGSAMAILNEFNSVKL